jgi:hypothetical protein
MQHLLRCFLLNTKKCDCMKGIFTLRFDSCVCNDMKSSLKVDHEHTYT